MKKGCFVTLVIWAAAAGAYWYYIHTRFVPPLDWIVPVVAGLMMVIVFGNLRQGVDSAINAVRASQQATFSGMTGERPKDGQVLTVVGHIRATGGSTLEAPITRRPAVLYGYDISHQSRSSDGGFHAAKDFAGFALAPSVIDSRMGPMRLLGFPNLEGFPKEEVADPDVARVNEYIAATPFQDMSGFNPLALYREIKELMTDDDGQLRKDWRMSSGEVTEDHDISEQVVTPGEQVTAIGRYSAAKQGLVQDIGGGNALRLIRGDAQMSSSALWKQAAGRVIGAIIFAAVVNGVLFGFLNLHPKPIAMPKSTQQRDHDIDQLHTASRNAEIPLMERLVPSTGVDARDAEMATPLMRAEDGKTAAWLIAHGADVNAVNYQGDTALMEAARTGKADVVAVLIGSKADVDIVSTKWKTTALQQALDAEHLDTAQLLRDAGAHDVTVTAKNGSAIGKNSEPVRTAMKYLDAIQHQDVAGIKILSTRDFDKDVDWKAVKESRPINPTLVSGFANENAATLALRGKRSDGIYSTWTLQLDRMSEGWKVSDERWETRFDSKNP
jgi:uncharacterized protein